VTGESTVRDPVDMVSAPAAATSAEIVILPLVGVCNVTLFADSAPATFSVAPEPVSVSWKLFPLDDCKLVDWVATTSTLPEVFTAIEPALVLMPVKLPPSVDFRMSELVKKEKLPADGCTWWTEAVLVSISIAEILLVTILLLTVMLALGDTLVLFRVKPLNAIEVFMVISSDESTILTMPPAVVANTDALVFVMVADPCPPVVRPREVVAIELPVGA